MLSLMVSINILYIFSIASKFDIKVNVTFNYKNEAISLVNEYLPTNKIITNIFASNYKTVCVLMKLDLEKEFTHPDDIAINLNYDKNKDSYQYNGYNNH